MGNPDIPSVGLTIKDGQLGAKVAAGSELVAYAGCCQQGAILGLAQYSNADTLLATHGYGPATEAAARHIELTGKPVLFTRLTTDTASVASSVDADAVVGTSVITLTGTPLDSYEGVFDVTTGGTIGTSGIVFRYSLDGARTWSPKIALGTATTYVITGTGVTLNFAAGTLVAADRALFYTTDPEWAASELDDLFDVYENSQQLWSALHLVGPAAKTDLDTLKTQLDAYKTTHKRYVFAFTGARLPDRPAKFTNSASQTLTFAESTPDTITRSAGSFITDGFKAGQQITVSGTSSNNGTFTIGSLTATVISVLTSDVLAAESTVADVVLTGAETNTIYQTALRTEFDSFESDRVSCAAGAGRMPSVLHATRWQFRRSPSWAAAVRFKRFALHESLGKVKNGSLSDVSIIDAEGNVEEWDSRNNTGLSSKDGSNGRFLTLQTYDGRAGAFICLPSIMHAPGSDFSRVHLRAAMDLACTISQRTLETELQDNVDLNSSGTILESEAREIENAARQQYEVGLLQPGHVSNAALTLSRNDALATPGTDITGKVTILPLGYIEGVSADIAFANPALES